MKKYTVCAVLTSALLTLTACGNSINTNSQESSDINSSVDESSQAEVTTVAENDVNTDEIVYTKFSKTIQAEDGVLSENVKVDKARKGYKADGYCTLSSTEDSVEVTFDALQAQFYDLKIKCASDDGAKCLVSINGSEHSINYNSDSFDIQAVENIYLDAGECTVKIQLSEGSADIDYIALVSTDDIQNLELKAGSSTLSNKTADYSAKTLYSYLNEGFGTNVLTGQYDSISTTIETDAVYQLTGKYPAIRFGDMMQATTKDFKACDADIDIALDYANYQGIIGYMWHWYAPINQDGYYSDDTDFDITKAVTEDDIATLDTEYIQKLADEGKISAECLAIIKDIDTVSEKLETLKNNGVAVLWRPLHEASNGYFWWGQDEESYEWLWKLMYTRMSDYHKLSNLIWVWSAQNASWYVGDDYCDVLSVDIYDMGNLSGQINSYLFLNSISDKKIIAMSECGNLPLADNIYRNKAMWSYIGQWGGNFLLNENGELEETNNTLENLVDFYNNSLTVTREELPNLREQATENQAADKETAESQSSDNTAADSDDTTNNE